MSSSRYCTRWGKEEKEEDNDEKDNRRVGLHVVVEKNSHLLRNQFSSSRPTRNRSNANADFLFLRELESKGFRVLNNASFRHYPLPRECFTLPRA